jgi:tetratricopeptide (TPR) repeat protein
MGEQVRTDLLDAAILWSDLHVRLAAAGEFRRSHEEALEVLAQAEASFGPNCVLSAEKGEHQRALGLAIPDAESPAARTAWEYYALGRFHLRTGDTTRAADDLDRALSLQPGALWANFYRGQCAFQTADYEEAVAAFSVCVALAPTSAWPAYHRALAELEQGRLDRARNDLRRVLAFKPSHEQARLLLAELEQRARLVPR